MFASQVTRVIEIDGHGEFTVRRLARKRLNEAASAVQLAAIDRFKRIGASVINEMRAVARDEAKKAEEAVATEKGAATDTFAQYDPSTLIEFGVIAWPNGLTPTREQIEDLEPEVEEPLARAVYELSRPKTEDERKKA